MYIERNPMQCNAMQHCCIFLLFFILGCFSVSAQSQDSAFYFSQKNVVLYIASGTVISNSQNIHVASPTDNALYIVGNTAVILNGTSNASIVHVPIRNKTTTTSLLAKKTKQTVRFQLREIARTNAKVQQSATVIKTRSSKENAILKMQFSCWMVISASHTGLQKKHTKSVTNFSQFYACLLGEKALSVAGNYFIYTYNNCVQDFADYALFSRPPTIFFSNLLQNTWSRNRLDSLCNFQSVVLIFGHCEYRGNLIVALIFRNL